MVYTTWPSGGCDPRELDGVVVASPSATHAAVALPYIEYGLPTFIEKPMATSVAEAEALRDAAERSGAPIFVGHLQLYNPAFRKALETLPALGAVRYLLFESMDSNPRADSSVLWDWLPHHLSMARAIFGLDATSIQAWSLAGGNSPQAAMSRFLFGATPVASVTSWLSPVRRRLMTAVCERGTLVFDDRAERKLVVYEALGGILHPAYVTEFPLTIELRTFCDAIFNGKSDRDHVGDGDAIVRIISSAEQSIQYDGATIHPRHGVILSMRMSGQAPFFT